MIKFEQLIEEYCPNGVEYMELGEIGSFYGGLSGKSKDDFTDGNADFITYMNVFSNMTINLDVLGRVKIGEKEKQNMVSYGDIVFTGSSETPEECGMSSVLTQKTTKKLYLNSFCFGMTLDEPELLLADFSKYLFRSEKLRNQINKTANGVTRYNVSKTRMKYVKIPIPPLVVQHEIVRVLESFSRLITELSTELSARKKQYEYYLNELLTFKEINS